MRSAFWAWSVMQWIATRAYFLILIFFALLQSE